MMIKTTRRELNLKAQELELADHEYDGSNAYGVTDLDLLNAVVNKFMVQALPLMEVHRKIMWHPYDFGFLQSNLEIFSINYEFFHNNVYFITKNKTYKIIHFDFL